MEDHSHSETEAFVVPVEPLGDNARLEASRQPSDRVLAQAVSAPRFVGKRAVESFSPSSFRTVA